MDMFNPQFWKSLDFNVCFNSFLNAGEDNDILDEIMCSFAHVHVSFLTKYLTKQLAWNLLFQLPVHSTVT